MKRSVMETGQRYYTQPTQLKPHRTLRLSCSSSRCLRSHLTSGSIGWTTAIYSVLIVLLLSVTVISGQTPSISSNRESNIFPEGTLISLSCFISSPSALSLSWSFPYNLENYAIVNSTTSDGSSNQYRSNLTYNATAQDNARTLTCTASSSSSASSQRITISVILAPNDPVITGPDSSNASVSYTWSCLSTGASYIPPNVYWRSGSGDALIDGVSKSTIISQKPNANFMYTITSTITMPLPPTSPEYILECRVVHFLNPYTIEKNATKHITVLYPPQIITTNELNVTINETQDVTLVCSISSNPSASQVIWYKDGKILDLNSTQYIGGNVSVPNLTIKNVSKLDAGNYTCTAVNQQGTGTSPNTTLIIKYVPVVTYNLTSYTGSAGGNLTIPCPVSAVPDVTEIIWQRIINSVVQTINVSSGSRFSGVDVSAKQYDLTISPLQSDDIGIYYCKAKNIMGDVTGSNLSVTVISLLVISQPNRTNIPSQENTTVTLECSVTPLDSLTELYWTKNGIRLSTVGSNKYSGGTKAIPNLTVNSLIDSDVGTYKCIAVNNFGTTGGSNITIDFQYKPRINISSTPVSITAGAPIRLFCNVSANPDISIFYWSKSGSGVVNPGNNSSKYGGGTITNTSLFIYLTDSYDSGNYTCSAGNSVGNTTSAAVALVVISKPLVTVSPTALTVPEGQAVVRFNCSVQAVPAVTAVGWIKDGKVLNMASQPAHYSGGTLAAPDLSILNVTKADAGIYACNASNDIGVGTSLNIRLDVTYSPTFNSSSGSSQGSVGQNITLSCDFAAYPPITQLYWLKDGNKLNLTLNPTKYSGGTVSVPSLTIINLNIATDPGSYQCVTNNSIGSNQGPSVNVTVVFDPYITVVNKTLTVTEGSNFTIDVAVHMYPPFSSITWYKDNNQVPVGDQTKFQNGTVSSPPLTVLSAAPQDTGTYRIVAHNSKITVNETIAVDVLYSPKISTSPLTFNVTVNSSKTIPCDVQAKPAVSSIRWQKLDLDSGQISSVTIGGRFSGGNTSDPSLTVTGILPSDAAVYQCSAFNALGNMSGPNITLRVFYKPEVSVSVFPSQITLDNKFELNCSAKGYPDVTSYMWFNGTTVVSRSNYFVKNNATSYDYIQFRCSVSNSMGTTNAYITPNILFKPVQLDNGQETILATKPSSVTLECKVIANPAPTSYRWFNGTYEIAGATNYSLTVLIDSDDDFTVYSCAATNTFGELNPARDFDIQQDVPKTGSSTGSSGLSTATIILIVIIAIILLIILILIVVFCCLQGLCQKCVKRKNVKVEPSNIKETSAAPSAASISNLLLSSKPVAPVAAGNPGLIISLPEKAGPKPFYLPPLDPQAEAATEKFYRERKRRSRRKKKAKSSKEDEKNLTENGSDEGKTSPPSMTGLSDVTMGNTSTA